MNNIQKIEVHHGLTLPSVCADGYTTSDPNSISLTCDDGELVGNGECVGN